MSNYQISVGQRIRFYDTDFCRKAPDDLKENWYREGIVTAVNAYVGALSECFFKVDKIIMDGKTFPRSWNIGMEFRFISDVHCVKVLSNQLFLNI